MTGVAAMLVCGRFVEAMLTATEVSEVAATKSRKYSEVRMTCYDVSKKRIIHFNLSILIIHGFSDDDDEGRLK